MKFPFKILSCLIVLLFSVSVVFSQVKPKEKWWLDEPYRLVQTNLREIDAIDFDVDKYVKSIKDIGANVILINVGGIVANYYTNLEYQYQNPNLKFDMIEAVIRRMHQEGIRVMGRFDFSKLNETLAAKKTGMALQKCERRNRELQRPGAHLCKWWLPAGIFVENSGGSIDKVSA